MNILVCISIVPDTTSKLAIDSSTGKIDKKSLTMIVSPYDDYALSKAVEIKEANQGNITILYIGDDVSSESIIRKCLAIGADQAFRINTTPLSSKQVADEIVIFSKSRNFDLILMGKESIDTNSGLVHRLVASGLGYIHFNPVMNLNVISENQLSIKVEVENGTAELTVKLPAVLGCQEPIAEWKIPSMRGIMMARTKPFEILESQIVSKLDHKEDIVVEKKRLQKIFKADELTEVVDIINHLI